MSLYSDYLTERTNKSVIETDSGFITYSFTDENTCYIEDIYIRPDFRKTREASKLADQVAEIAKSKGCTKLLGSVIPSTKNSTTSLKVLLGYDMKLLSSVNDFILFSKDIK